MLIIPKVIGGLGLGTRVRLGAGAFTTGWRQIARGDASA